MVSWEGTLFRKMPVKQHCGKDGNLRALPLGSLDSSSYGRFIVRRDKAFGGG